MRIDQLLVERGLASSRSQAQRLIASGVRWLGPNGWRTVAKNGDEVGEAAELQLVDEAEARYVSRGGLKLEGALRELGLDVSGLDCLDVGQSTGGFTDCLLQRGAARVVGVDVGQSQLHPKLRADARVVAIEQVNARHADALSNAINIIANNDHGKPSTGTFDLKSDPKPDPRFDLVTGDLSFISLTLVLPALVPLLRANGTLLMLVKPQFELQPGQVGKGGIVKDAALYAVVEQRLRDCCAGLGLAVRHWIDSPITGGDGNREFFVHAEPNSGGSHG